MRLFFAFDCQNCLLKCLATTTCLQNFWNVFCAFACSANFSVCLVAMYARHFILFYHGKHTMSMCCKTITQKNACKTMRNGMTARKLFATKKTKPQKQKALQQFFKRRNKRVYLPPQKRVLVAQRPCRHRWKATFPQFCFRWVLLFVFFPLFRAKQKALRPFGNNADVFWVSKKFLQLKILFTWKKKL